MTKHNSSLIEFLEPDFEFGDDRGSLTQLFRSGWSQVNYIHSCKDSFRGGHYHQLNNELFYVIDGEFELQLKSIDSDVAASYTITKGKMFKILSRVSHSFTFKTDCMLISAYDNGVELDDGMDIIQG